MSQYRPSAINDESPVGLLQGMEDSVWLQAEMGGDNRAKLAGDHAILMLDRGPDGLHAMGFALLEAGYRVEMVQEEHLALKRLDADHFDLLVARSCATPGRGSGLVGRAKETHPNLRVIWVADELVRALPSPEAWSSACDCMVPAGDADQLLQRVGRCLHSTHCPHAEPRRDDRSRRLNQEILQTLAVMSHDVRGSLVSIGAGLKLLNRGVYGKLDSGVAKKVGDLYARVQDLAGVAEDYLGRAFLLKESRESDHELVDLRADVLDPVLGELASEAQELGVCLNGSAFPAQNVMARGSRVWLRAVFRNILTNALKYGGAGCRIEIDLRELSAHYEVRISNTGHPIPEEYRDRLFTRCGRLPGGERGNACGGVGLGLYMIQEIIHRHGGRIWYEAAEGGSRFVFTLPRA